MLPLNPPHAPAAPFVDTAAVGMRLAALGHSERLTLIGIDRDGVGDALRGAPAGIAALCCLARARRPRWSTASLMTWPGSR